jgi:hypothetical protein
MTPSYLPMLSLGRSMRAPEAAPDPRSPAGIPPSRPWGAPALARGPVARVPVLPLLTSAYPRRLAAR